MSLRSPYIVTINETGQVNAGVNIYVWRHGETQPTTPTIELFQNVLSTVNTSISFNVSPYIEKYVANISPLLLGGLKDSNEWVYVALEYLSDGVVLDTIYSIATQAYTNYGNGINFDYGSDFASFFCPLKTEITEVYLPLGTQRYIDVAYLGDTGDLTVQWDVNGTITTETITTGSPKALYTFPISPTDLDEKTILTISHSDWGFPWTVVVKRECEPKYTPIMIDFVNKLGGWDFLTCFKKSRENIATTSKDYQLFQDVTMFTPAIGESKSFNYKLTRSVRVNTGWVHESTGKLIEELLCSNTILVDGRPAKLKTNSLELMKSINGKQINYSLEFEYNYNDINSVV